jgi:chaperonin GroES
MMDEAPTADINSMTPPQVSAMAQALEFANLAAELQKKDPDLLNQIGGDVVTSFENDDLSRKDWLDRNKEYMKLATQVMERKTWPWDGAANVKYPLLTTAALQFASRAYGSLVPSFDVVKAKVIGADDTGEMIMLANKLSTHMSYEVMYKIEDWEENMDKLCFVLPIVGTMFKKIYYSNTKKKIVSDLLTPKDIVINYYVKKIQDASRITEVQWFTENEIVERQNKEDWVTYDTKFGPGKGEQSTLSDDKTTGMQAGTPDEETPRKILVQYRRIDLDKDDYKEPYIVTVDYETKKVLRIVANFYPQNIEFKKDGKGIACITPAEWFVKFDFLPNPDGGFYGIGFGILLGGLNDMVNTVTNQLLDSATLANLQAGFIGRGLRDNKQKNMGFRPGEWKWVNNPGKDLKENIFPLPVREPSQTMFNLLGTMVQSGKEVASVADIFTGKMPGQNTPASTTMATIEQGLKVFTSIYKRIYRSLGKEFQLIFNLMEKYAPTETIKFVAELKGEEGVYEVSRFDYQKAKDLLRIIPAADPNMVSETQKLLKISGLYELAQYGTINMQEMTKQALLYQGQENIQKLMEMPPPPEPLEITLKKMELEAAAKDRQLESMKVMSENNKRISESMLNYAKAKELGNDKEMAMMEIQIKREEAQLEMHMKQMELEFEREKHRMEMQQKQEEHQMDMTVKKSEAQLNLASKEIMAKQNISHNEAKNEKQIELMDKKASAQSKIKEKNASKGSVG